MPLRAVPVPRVEVCLARRELFERLLLTQSGRRELGNSVPYEALRSNSVVSSPTSGQSRPSIHCRPDGRGRSPTGDASALPSLVRWQFANVAGHYVLGLEPCTGRAEPTSNELSFPTLQRGKARRLGVTIELLKFPSGPLARP